jgi:hypothetical protein
MRHLKKFENINDFDWDRVLKKDRKSQNKWESLEKELMALTEKYKNDFGVDSYGVIDAIYQILDSMYQKK